MRLAIVLRFLAGGMTTDLMMIYKVSMAEVYRTIWRGVDAINESITVQFPLDDLDKLRVLESEFRAKSRSKSWVGEVGAIDGCHFRMKNPGRAVPDPRAYFVDRKKEFALLGIAICDSARRFTYWDISCLPTTHDSVAWAQSDLGRSFLNGDLPAPYFLVGDAAFTSSPSMVVPYGKASNTNFDFVQSSNRMAIECAFGVLIRRWGILWRPLEVAFDRRAALVGCCMRLHNFCIDQRISEEHLPAMDGEMGIAVPGEPGVVVDRWEKRPVFDREGRPVYALSIVDEAALSGGGGGGGVDANSTRERLRAGVESDGVSRPAPMRW